MGRAFRYRDRKSYKASEVVGLFVVSIFGGMLFFGLCALVDFLIGRFTGR